VPRIADDDRDLALAGACSLSRWAGHEARCRWCDAGVAHRRSAPAGAVDPSARRWCSHRCLDEFRRNHWWDQAREAALVRDGGCCVRCGRGPEVATVAKLFIRATVPMGVVDAARLWRTQEWQRLHQACQLEVNHIVPRRGGGYHAGCHHHLDGLETLCHRCHATVTAHQQQALRSTGLADAG